MKKWKPKDEESFYCIDDWGKPEEQWGWMLHRLDSVEQKEIYWLGIYKTRKEAAAMAMKIKKLVRGGE